jgi:hypothetical protein
MYGDNMTVARSLYLTFLLLAATNELRAAGVQGAVLGLVMSLPTGSVRHVYL